MIGEEESGLQLFSPNKVQAAKDYQALKEEEEKQRKQEIANRKVLAAAKKVQKEQEKAERATIAAEKRKVAAEIKSTKEAEKQARAATKQKVAKQKQLQLELRRQSIRPTKTSKQQINGLIGEAEVLAAEGVVRATSSGRQVQKPRRFFL